MYAVLFLSCIFLAIWLRFVRLLDVFCLVVKVLIYVKFHMKKLAIVNCINLCKKYGIFRHFV